MIFTENRYDRSMEQMMKGIPNFYPRGSGIVVTGRFQYTAEMCDCKLCGEYIPKKGCGVPRCVCLEERIAVGVASVKEIMNDILIDLGSKACKQLVQQLINKEEISFIEIFEGKGDAESGKKYLASLLKENNVPYRAMSLAEQSKN